MQLSKSNSKVHSKITQSFGWSQHNASWSSISEFDLRGPKEQENNLGF